MTSDLFCESLLRLRKSKATKTFAQAAYLAHDLEANLLARLPENWRSLTILVIGCPGKTVQNHFTTLSFEHFDPLRGEKIPTQKAATYDLIIEGFIFHWLNDPLTHLVKIKDLLKPGGIYLSGFLGGTTLTELRQSLLQADIDLYDGAFARISPMIKPEAATRLLQTAGFINPIVDHEEIGVSYPTLKSLIQDLRAMGESNALTDQRAPKITKTYFTKAEATYRSLFPPALSKENQDLTATYDFVTMTGWRSL